MTKLALIWSVAIAIAIVPSCSITHRSGEYACVTTADCDSNRLCSNGFCVVAGSGIDAPTGPKKDAPSIIDAAKIDAADERCPMGCSTCNLDAKECIIDCGSPGAQNCNAQITCPSGWHCTIGCDRQNDCKSGINCANAASCDIQCSGSGACRGIVCGAAPCDVTCSGFASCTQNIACGPSCECNVHCSGAGQGTCGGDTGQAVSCGSNACDAVDGGCTSFPQNVCSSVCQ